MTNLVGRTPDEIEALVGPHVDRPFRSRQVAAWVVHRHATSFEQMSDLPAALRATLSNRFDLREPDTARVRQSRDGCQKYLFRLLDGATVEGVTMPGDRKVTLCLSSQAGCSLGCRFCVTGRLGSGRNLTADEMVGQHRVMLRGLRSEIDRVNVVFMGMGEPLLNTQNLGHALEVLYHTISPRRITVSTAGVIPGIAWLAQRPRRPKLAVSLNAPDQVRRQHIMPLATRYPLDELVAELRRFPLEKGRRITFEYVLIRDFNDSVTDARAVARLLRPMPSKINLIPLNEDPVHLPGMQQPSPETVAAFADTLRAQGLTATVRLSRGTDVGAACGQLKGETLNVER